MQVTRSQTLKGLANPW